jgi:dihydrofolate synthase/folylpolyglutamate synthase
VDPFQYLADLEKFGIKFGLHNISVLCAALDHPERACRSVIIAGTNGKGSVAAMVDTAGRAAGLRTARYTSPHLVRLEERFVIDGRPVATERLREALARIPPLVATWRERGELQAEPTFFEVTTAVAFDLFRQAGVDLVVLEVGMGGRFDATSIAPSMAAAITTIDFDHEKYLGHTLAEIAFEKAGVIKAGMPVVVGETKPEPFAVIAAACRERDAVLIDARAGVTTSVSLVDGRTQLRLDTPARAYAPLRLALRGRHQVANAVVAVRLLEALERLGLPITAEAIVAGLTDVAWRGRLDLVRTARGAVLLDGAHNRAGARALADYLAEVYPAGLPMVFGAMGDKDAAGMLEVLLPHATQLVVTRPRNPRAQRPDALAEVARAVRPIPVTVEDDPARALRRAQDAGPVVLVAGSLFLVGDILAELDTPDTPAR